MSLTTNTPNDCLCLLSPMLTRNNTCQPVNMCFLFFLTSTGLEAFDFLELNYEVEWPMTMILTSKNMASYNKIFNFLFKLKRISFLLRDIWIMFKEIRSKRRSSTQRTDITMELCRHEMNHLITTLQNYIINQIHQVTWREFEMKLEQNVSARHADLTCRSIPLKTFFKFMKLI